MIKLNCSICLENCCGKNKDINEPILLPYEIERFNSDDLSTEDGTIFRIKRAEDGNCKFLKDKSCGIYDKRPMECRIYPYVFNFINGELSLELDKKCPQGHCLKDETLCLLDSKTKSVSDSFWEVFPQSS